MAACFPARLNFLTCTTAGKKKPKRIAKGKSISSGPAVDIQEIINQLLAKNKVPTAEGSQPTEPGTAEPPVPKATSRKQKPKKLTTSSSVEPLSQKSSQSSKPMSQSNSREHEPQIIPSSPVAASSPIARRTAARNTTPPCPVCSQTPFHLKYNCPIINAGPISIAKRITELKAQKPVNVLLVQDLEDLLEKATARQDQGQTITEPLAIAMGNFTVPTSLKALNDEDDSSDDDAEPIVSQPVSMQDPDDELDALLLGTKRSVPKERILAEIDSEEGEEEREELEEEEEEEEAKRFRKASTRYANEASSDEEEGENELGGSPPLEDRVVEVVPSLEVSCAFGAR